MISHDKKLERVLGVFGFVLGYFVLGLPVIMLAKLDIIGSLFFGIAGLLTSILLYLFGVR